MDYTNLQVLAEVSVALLGFSGLTVVLGQSRFDQAGIVFRTQGLIYTSSLAFVGSLLPLVGVPILLGAFAMAALMSAACMSVLRTLFGASAPKFRISPLLTWTFLPVYMSSTLALWFSIFALPEQLLFIYKLAIGCNLLLAVVYFIRLVTSTFGTNEVSSDT
jgi:hypothetical protein